MLYDLPDFPVIVVHLEYPEGSGLASCCDKFIPLVPDKYKNIPRILCSGCLIIGDRDRPVPLRVIQDGD